MIDRAPRRKVMGQQFPGTAAPHSIEDGVENLATTVPGRTATGFGGRNKRFQLFPFGIREVGIVSGSRRVQSASRLRKNEARRGYSSFGTVFALDLAAPDLGVGRAVQHR